MNNLQVIEQVMIKGDLSALSADQKIEYYAKVCESVGLNPLTKPFEYMRLSGKEVLYATKGATEQLRNIHKISLKIVSRDKIDNIYVVTAEAVGADGRCDSATGAVPIEGLNGEKLANAFMKAETKAKRRVTLSICGLNMLDETEVETIKDSDNKKIITKIETIAKKEIAKKGLTHEQKTEADRKNSSYATTNNEPNIPNIRPVENNAGDSSSRIERSSESVIFTTKTNEHNNVRNNIIGVGRNKGKTFEEAGKEAIQKSYDYLVNEVAKGNILSLDEIDFIKTAEIFLNTNNQQ